MDDGLLEIFGLKQGWHASFVMVELISAKHIAQKFTAFRLLQLDWKLQAVSGEMHICRWMENHGNSQ
nr:TPA_asm: hypothetical protein HUJ06_029081 [Nelumbo nucifera]